MWNKTLENINENSKYCVPIVGFSGQQCYCCAVDIIIAPERKKPERLHLCNLLVTRAFISGSYIKCLEI